MDSEEGRQILWLPLQSGTEVKAPQVGVSETICYSFTRSSTEHLPNTSRLVLKGSHSLLSQ